MGLDSYAYRVLPEMATGDFVIKRDVKEPEEFQYWRRNNVIHDFMTALYRKKGGTEKIFNCIPLHVTLEDLNDLEQHIKKNKTLGAYDFPFDFEDKEDFLYQNDINFIKTAQYIITEEGNCVYYDSWW